MNRRSFLKAVVGLAPIAAGGYLGNRAGHSLSAHYNRPDNHAKLDDIDEDEIIKSTTRGGLFVGAVLSALAVRYTPGIK
ncbi:MAG: twin-arginine translocation signal domain-containing protein [Pseudomonadota bacterium]